MAGYVMAFAMTLVFCSVCLSVLIHKGIVDKDDTELLLGLGVGVVICSLLWFIFWPVFFTGLTIFLIYSLVGKFLTKGNKDA